MAQALENTITLVSAFRSAHHVKYFTALEKGFAKLGINTIRSTSPQSKIIATWGWRTGKQYRISGHEVLVVERGYIGDRMNYTSLGWNGLNGYAEFPKYPDDGGKRFADHGGELKPWKEYGTGEYILILGQVRNDASLQNTNMVEWYSNIAERLKAHYNLPIYFRPHPESLRRGGYRNIPGVANLSGDLQSAIDGALFTVSYNSNSSLDSIIAGVPSYAGEGGMAYELCMSEIGTLRYPDREKRLNEIAHCQWSVDEIASGEALKGLLCKFGR